ncbi:MAG: HAD family hydrolase [Anaerolineae bacterium]|nr:HAD family hydrolase [Anaerolineae bacterium]
MSRWKAIAFDLDDTLYPEKAFVLSGFQAVANWAEQHLNIPSQQGYAGLIQLFDQGVRGDTFNRWLAIHHLPHEDFTARLVAVYRDHIPTLDPFADAVNLLETLHGRYRLGIVSDGYLVVQRNKLAALQLGHYFDAVVFSDEWGREAWKPSVRPFVAVLEGLGVAADEAIYIGDNPAKDFLGARQVGMTTIWVKRPQGEYSSNCPPTDHHMPHFTIGSLSEVLTIIEET